MKAAELKQLTDEELRQRLEDSRQELFDFRVQKATGQMERPLRARTMRREVARVLTVMKQRGLT
jgi:large subunit ribosomal protein L29